MTLYTYGERSLLNIPGKVAVIGSRNASERAHKAAYNIGKYLARIGFVIVNGMAIGIDTEALKGALSENGQAIVFMPCGRNVVYPRSNKTLYDQILRGGGCICSKYPDGTRPERFRFIERDYLQALYSDSIIVIECKSGSGTMHTVRQANFEKKPVGVIPFETSGNKEIVEKYGGIWLKDYAAIQRFAASAKRAYTPEKRRNQVPL